MRYFFCSFLIFILPFFNNGNISSQEIPVTPLDKTDKILNLSKSTNWTPSFIDFRVHRNGRFWNTIMNAGIIGNFFKSHDPEVQRDAANYYFPRYSHIRHGFFTSLWVGGIVDGDTLVSTACDVDAYALSHYYFYKSEFYTDLSRYEIDGIFEDSRTDFNDNYYDITESEVKYRCTYNDTLVHFDLVDLNPNLFRKHQPLYLEITQTSYSWSYKYAEDFIIINYKIKNIGSEDIKDGYVGFYHLGCNHYTGEQPGPKLDAIPGYIDSIPYEYEEIGYEQMNTAWTIDFDGWPMGDSWWQMSTRNALGIAPLDLPSTAYNINFNWWFNGYNRSWGPRKKDKLTGTIRMYDGDFGQPLDDKSKYHMMSHPEVDYNGYYSALDLTRFGWNEPFEYADELVNGFLPHYLLSFGPFNIPKNKGVDVSIVMAVGENVHNIPYAYRDYFDPERPHNYMHYLDFSDLINNIRWAKRIYDNPGVDTDADGDSGKYFFLIDSVSYDSTQIFYTGDGVPDFKGPAPPPPPDVRVYPVEGKLVVRWNGRVSENYFDSFSNSRDFEGYRVYLARSKDENDIILMASYDLENYNRYRWNSKYKKYELIETPFTLDSLRSLYGDDFEPLEYTRVDPLTVNEHLYYFTKVGYNTSQLSDPDEIHKLYPDAILDTTDVDDEGRMRYYEYEYIIENLLPTVPYYVSVTAFDFGLPSKSLVSLESSKYNDQLEAFAVDNFEENKETELNVFCYPNPYRVDDDYDKNGFENRFTNLYNERARNLYFANLPQKCTISIFTLDGDLVKRIEHDDEFGSGTIAIERFDLIGRNDMAVTTGLYYWVVESEYGNQIGKLAIIK